jgi:hypothetical protein
VRFEAPLLEEGLFMADMDLDDIRRERVALPLLRDERPDFVLRQLERLIRVESGQLSQEEEKA